jgi:cholesterol transport system auxiliary component
MIHTRRLFLVSAASLALTGCGNLLGPPDAGQIYTLNPVLPPVPAAAGAKAAYALAVMRPDALNGLDTDRIALVQADATMDFYAAAQYPDSLPALVQAALISGFEASGRIDQVAREQDALHADYDLITEIRNFEAHYPAPDAVPTVTVTLAVRLASAHGRKILGSFTATQSQPCAANSAGAVAQALGQALGQAVQAIVTWTLGAAPPVPPAP